MGNEVQTTQDGSHTLLSEKFGVTYHSKYGAIQESIHVFIEAGLRYRVDQIRDKSQASTLSILEVGLGTGLNVYLSLLESISPSTDYNINYTSLETSPISNKIIEQLNYHEQLKQADSKLFQAIHSCEWGNFQQLAPNFELKKVKQSLESFETTDKFDLIFFDAFAPESQPELWEVPVFQKMYDCVNDGGILTTYCAKGQVKRNMKSVGFEVEGIPGPPGKREMTRALRSFLV